MITIIHGDDLSTSRNYYLSQKTKDTLVFDGDKITVTDLAQVLQGDSLFNEEKRIVIENLFSKRKPSKTTDELLEFLKQENASAMIILWESKPLTKKQLSFFSKATLKQFSFPQTLFIFLDAIKPHSGRQIIPLFHKAREQSETELLFFMLTRHIRLLLALTDDNHSAIDEVKRLQPWQKKKMQIQSALFSVDQLKTMLITLAQKRICSVCYHFLYFIHTSGFSNFY